MNKTCAHCGTALDPKDGNYKKMKFCGKPCYQASYRTPKAVEARFWAKVKKGEGCWIWQACRSSVTRYGTFSYMGSNINAHRAAYILTYGPVPADKDVLHTCHNGHLGCVTPHHLYLGTDKENSRDRVLAGRGFKFTAEQILEIRRKADAGIADKVLAAEYNTAPRYIWGIRTRRNWKHIKEENDVFA